MEKFLSYLVAIGVTGAGLFNILYSWLSHHPGRYLVVQEYLPLGVIRSTWLLSVFTGLALLFLGWGLAKRKRRAWVFALIALALAAGAHLIKGLDYDAAFVNLAFLMMLLLLRRSYSVASDPTSFSRSLLVIGTIFLSLYIYGLLGFYLLDRHFGARFDLFASAREAGRVLFTGSYPSRFPRTHRGRWFLDSLWFGEILALAYGTGLIFQPVLYRRRVRPGEVRRVREILNRWGRSTLAFLLLLPDKSYFFGSSRNSVIGYTVVGNIAVALGDPIGPPTEIEEAIAEFRKFCNHHDWYPVFFQVTEEFLSIYTRLGFEKLKIGEEKEIAFANVVPAYQSRVGTIDLMRRLPDAPNGTIELLFVRHGFHQRLP